MASPPPLRTDFQRSIGFLLTALVNKLNSGASRRLRRRLDVGLMEWRVIALLGVEGEATPARIGQVAGVDKSVVSRAVNTLERRGLVRVFPGPQPGRQTSLELTPAGMALHDRGILEVLRGEEALLEGVSAAERETLILLLKRLTANLPRLEEIQEP